MLGGTCVTLFASFFESAYREGRKAGRIGLAQLWEDDMFRFLRRGAVAVAAAAVDPWKGVGSQYVGRYQKELDSIAGALSCRSSTVRSRFNPHLQCGELYDETGTLAQIQMHGEVGSVYETIVTTKLPSEKRLLFSSLLPGVEFVNA